MTIDELSTLPCGAKFFRADLHIHSLGASHDVSDQLMTPEAIVATAIAENLTLISITDHNEIRNVERTIIAALSACPFSVGNQSGLGLTSRLR
jgi:predicted metal-dependent phosphoesterase TrpH